MVGGYGTTFSANSISNVQNFIAPFLTSAGAAFLITPAVVYSDNELEITLVNSYAITVGTIVRVDFPLQLDYSLHFI